MKILEYLQQNIVYLDGGMGTLLQEKGLPLGELPERWNLSHAEIIQEIHSAYFNAGSNVVATNTFGANALKFNDDELEAIICAAVKNAKIAAEQSVGTQEKWIALDVGPCGKLLKPYGDLAFEEAVELFAKTIRLGVQYGVDLILIETMNDSLECKAAVLAAKENCDLPVFASCAFGEDGKLMTGASVDAMVAMLEGLRVDALGVNCSVGPKQLSKTVDVLLKYSSLPIIVKPNAGLPVCVNGEARFDVNADDFSQIVADFAAKGVRLLGGCCGTTPDYIQKTVQACKSIQPLPLQEKDFTCISSYTHAVYFDNPVLIGERINPTGKKRFKQALIENDVSYILSEGLTQQENGAHALDVNVGIPNIDERIFLPKYVEELQAVIDLPLQLDTSDFTAMERAMRIYNGKPLVNSVNGKAECMENIFPLVKKYGGVVIALTLDENGIPDNSFDRIEIARKIIQKAAEYGIKKKDILVDPLAMTIATDSQAANVTLEALKMLKGELGVGTSLGVSNVSFGLPNRDAINAAFFALALQNGLSAAIINPNSLEIRKLYHAYCALKGLDENCQEYIRFITENGNEMQTVPVNLTAKASTTEAAGNNSSLRQAIMQGLKELAAKECTILLQNKQATDVIEGEIVPALDAVGRAYEEKKAFLPQLLMSADAAKAAFEVIKSSLLGQEASKPKKSKIILATVQGDIHDIGKNIVGTILSNYGYHIIDLGRDVAPETILEAVVIENASIVGLSALMTTTVKSMEETVRLLHEKVPFVKIMVGGAVLTQDYAQEIGADGYARDAMAAVRLADAWQNR